MRDRIEHKRYGWTVAIMIFFLVILVLFVFKVDPDVIKNIPFPNSYLLFVTILGIFSLLLTAIIFNSTKMGLWWTLGVLGWFYLKVFEVGNMFTIGSLLGFLICGHLYIRYTWRK